MIIEMARVYFSLGSNQGDRLKALVKATKLIDKRIGSVICYSAVVESEPWGFHAETNFYNQVLLVETMLSAHQVLTALLDIEKTLGRIRTGNTYSSRAIDIDILFYDQDQFNEGDLIIPHPMLHLRRFVMEPLASVAPDFIHPVFQMSISELLNRMKEGSEVSVVVENEEFAKLLDSITLS